MACPECHHGEILEVFRSVSHANKIVTQYKCSNPGCNWIKDQDTDLKKCQPWYNVKTNYPNVTKFDNMSVCGDTQFGRTFGACMKCHHSRMILWSKCVCESTLCDYSLQLCQDCINRLFKF